MDERCLTEDWLRDLSKICPLDIYDRASRSVVKQLFLRDRDQSTFLSVEFLDQKSRIWLKGNSYYLLDVGDALNHPSGEMATSPDKFFHLDSVSNPSEQWVRGLAEVAPGEVWFQVLSSAYPRTSDDVNQTIVPYWGRRLQDGKVQAVAPEIPRDVWHLDLYTDPLDRVWLLTSDWLWRAENAHSSFTRIGAPDIRFTSTHGMTVASDGAIWVSSAIGMFTSRDDGRTWSKLEWTDPKEDEYLTDVNEVAAKIDMHIGTHAADHKFGGIVEDTQGHIWASSYLFLIEYDPRAKRVNSYFIDPIHPIDELPPIIPSTGIPARLEEMD